MALLKATCRFSNQELAAASAHQAHTTFIRQKRGEQAGLTPAAYSVPASAATVWHSVNKGGKQKQNKKSTPKGTPPHAPQVCCWNVQLSAVPPAARVDRKAALPRRELAQEVRTFGGLLLGRELFNLLTFIMLVNSPSRQTPISKVSAGAFLQPEEEQPLSEMHTGLSAISFPAQHRLCWQLPANAWGQAVVLHPRPHQHHTECLLPGAEASQVWEHGACWAVS